MLQELPHITAVHVYAEASQLPTSKGSPSFPARTYGAQGRVHAAMGRRSVFLACVTCVDIYAQNPTELTSQFFFQLFWRLLCTEAHSFRSGCACSWRPMSFMLMLVLESLCHEQLVLYEASVLLSDPLQHCFLHHS